MAPGVDPSADRHTDGGGWQLGLLGQTSLIAPDGRPLALPGRKHAALLAFVAVASDRCVSRDRLLSLLWGSRSEQQAKTSLRGVLSELRQSTSAYRTPLIVTDRREVRTPHVEVDVHALRAALAGTSDLAGLRLAVERFEPPFLERLHVNERDFEQWKDAEQSQLQRTYRSLVSRYLEALVAEESAAELLEVAGKLLASDAADESAHRALMSMYLFEGRPALAVRQYEQCRSVLRREYDVAPAEATNELYERVRSGTQTPPLMPEGRAVATPVATNGATALAVASMSASGDAQDIIEIGMVIAEEIVGAAAAFRWFRVVPSSEVLRTELRYAGAGEIARSTGARYVVDGRLRRSADGLVLSLALVDTERSHTAWSERFELNAEQVRNPLPIVARIASRLDVQIRASEIRRAEQMPRDSHSSYECALLALSCMYELTPDSFETAQQLFERAAILQPQLSSTYAFWCLWQMFCTGQGWKAPSERQIESIDTLARRGLKLDPTDPFALAMLGHFESFWHHDINSGLALLDKSLQLNPYSSFAWMLSGTSHAYSGNSTEALTRIDHAFDLCPIEAPVEFMYLCARCIAHLFDANYEAAAEWGFRTVNQSPAFTNGYKLLLVALGHLGRQDQAARFLARLRKLEPNFSTGAFVARYPCARPQDRERFVAGLQLAGAPP